MSLENDYYEYLMHAKLTGDLNHQEEAEFHELLESNEQFSRAFRELQSLFTDNDLLSQFKRLKNPNKWKDILSESSKKQLSGRIIRVWMSVAAVLIAISLGGWWMISISHKTQPSTVIENKKSIMLHLGNGNTIDLSSQKGSISTSGTLLNNEDQTLTYASATGQAVGLNKLQVPIGMDYKIVLADGTKVWLNAATQLEFPFNFVGPTREIKINGEAYIEVANDKSKPFIVQLQHGSVQVLGTEFNINSYNPSNVKVSLVSGSILMKTLKQEFLIAPGKEAILNTVGNITQQEFNSKYTLSWRIGKFYFHNAGLQEISEILPRWYGIQVIIDNKNYQSRRFTGMLDKKQPIELFMEDIRGISGIETYLDENRVLHFK